MRRFSAVILAMIFMLTLLAGCTAKTDPGTAAAGGSTSGASGNASAGKEAEIALIIYPSEYGVNDRSYCQMCWEGVKAYGDANGKTYTYYQPTDSTLESYMAAFDLAIKGGAKIVCCAGYEFGDSLGQAQTKYPDVSFIGIDVSTLASVSGNTYSIVFNVTEGTFFAGAAAVYEGYTNIGVLNVVNIAPVNQWLYGFIQGVNWAAAQKGVKGITVTTYYVGNSDVSPENQSLAASWFQSGIQCIFANLGNGNASVFSAAEAAKAACIGVDTDQYEQSETVMTSSVKELGKMLQNALDLYYSGKFPGGKVALVGAEEYGVGLAMAHSRMKTYTDALYQEQYEMMRADKDGMKSGLYTIDKVADVSELAEKMQNITVKVIEE